MASNKLYRVLHSLYNTPHLVTIDALRPIVDYLEQRNSLGVTLQGPSNVADDYEEDEPEIVEGFGEIAVDGVLTYKPVYGICGPVGCSYQGILAQARDLIDGGVHTIILNHSSPGGQAAHCFSTALELRRMADEADVRLISYIDLMSASASLALGIVADEVVIHPSASTGSIGCVVALYDQSKAMEKAGIKPIYISSTPGKTPFNDDGSFSKPFLNKLQEDVTRLGNEFASHVHQFSGIPVDDIINMDAQMFHAQAALEAGLVNHIMDHNQFANYLAASKRKQDA